MSIVDSSLVVTIPLKTVSEANSRDGWRAQAARAQDQRRVVKQRLFGDLATIRTLMTKHLWPVTITMTRIAPGTLDAHDNLRRALKACVDGVCDALGVADNYSRLTFQYGQEKVPRFTRGRQPSNRYAVQIVVRCGEPKAVAP